MQLRPYREAFGAEAILPVFLERLRGQGQEQLERVCRFLGYRGQPVWSEVLGAVNASAERERQTPLRDAIRSIPGARPLARALVPRGVREQVRGRLWRMRDRPQLSPAMERRVAERFDEDLAELGSWLGAPLSCASFRTVVDRPSWAWRKETKRRRDGETE
jgi:hypothetical protein